MSREPVGWVFNLDAEDELLRGGPHTPSLATRERVTGLLPKLQSLMRPWDETVWPTQAENLRGRWGRLWCPTPWARAQLQRAGLRLPPFPSTEVVRQVNHRRFAHQLGQALPGARFVQNERELVEALSDLRLLAQVSAEQNWLLKRPLGYAGRGRRKVASATFSPSDRVWIEAALRSGEGLQVEPFVERVADFGLHGWLGPEGMLSLGTPTVQQVSSSGTWVSTEQAPPGALDADEHAALAQAARSASEALKRAGYFGPFGVDAFRWRAPDSTLHFQPRCELNARYSMGWATGMGGFEIPNGHG